MANNLKPFATLFVILIMDINFSRPDNARQINIYRVLNALRENSLTRADLSKQLGINKVSMSEIVQKLIDDGMLKEGSKVTIGNGRPGTSLSLSPDYGAVIGVDIQTKSISITLFSIEAKPLRLEKFPRADLDTKEKLKEAILNSINKMSRLTSLKILGITIAVSAYIENGILHSTFDEVLDGINFKELFSSFPYPVAITTSLEAQAEAERFYFQTTLEDMLFVNWGEHLTSAIILKDRILPNMDFGHLKVSDKNLCHCGSIGCLETVASGWGLRSETARKTGHALSVRDMLKTEEKYKEVLNNAVETLAKALVLAVSCTGVNAVIIGGGISNLPDEYFAHMMDIFIQRVPQSKKSTPIYRSAYKEKGTVQGAGVKALDTFFFNKSLLLTLGY